MSDRSIYVQRILDEDRKVPANKDGHVYWVEGVKTKRLFGIVKTEELAYRLARQLTHERQGEDISLTKMVPVR